MSCKCDQHESCMRMAMLFGANSVEEGLSLGPDLPVISGPQALGVPFFSSTPSETHHLTRQLPSVDFRK